ncbi:MAG TPA: hypothetical protein PLI09_06475 [Candidatus Hydrogenedentes bacterium]|nr:hypothetical protein [Candidatus Hydrogenedentota bacterium]
MRVNILMLSLIMAVLNSVIDCTAAHAAELEGPLAGSVWSPSREWVPKDMDGSVHCLGNGRLCVYGEGPNILQIFGPPYSTTNIGRISLEQPEYTSESRRVMGAAIWEHRIRAGENVVAVVTDFVDSEQPCFVRHVETTIPLMFVLHPESGMRKANNTAMMQTSGAKDGFLLETPIGKPSVPFGNYPIPFAFFHQFAWRGEMEVMSKQTDDAIRFTFVPGQGVLFVSGGPELSSCMDNMKAVLSTEYSSLLTRTKSWWAEFTAHGKNFEKELPADVPMRARLVQVLDDAAVLIKAQQAVEGGILAGYPYHLGYVRDQYGTHRGLVALGHEEMSRDILGFYYGVFEKFGQIHNAQAFGIPGLFHVHENDEVEITGYITLQAFDYLARSGDIDFVRKIFPMLECAWTVQQRNFIKDMLPFNGDETYVAGGILPRSALNDGSAEATMLFIESGRLLLDFAEKQGVWAKDQVEKERQLLNQIRDSFRENFWQDGKLITNNPERSRDPQALPDVRHGVCEACTTVQWTLRTANDRYVCLDCLSKPPLPSADPKVYVLQSVSLTPIYFHTSLFSAEELQPQVEEILQSYKSTGKLPSRPDSDVSVGYDYGLLLYALTELNHPLARELYEKTLQLADATGAWAEYYRDHKPSGTRCRPWESAMNVEALLHWVEKKFVLH